MEFLKPFLNDVNWIIVLLCLNESLSRFTNQAMAHQELTWLMTITLERGRSEVW